jgi:hypothetical protein
MKQLEIAGVRFPGKKITILAGIAVFLICVYLITIFFDPERAAARRAAFTWLPAGGRDTASRIEISLPDGEQTVMTLKNGSWFVERDGESFPVKQGRVDDLLRILSTRGAFPRQGSSAAHHEALGLSPERAARLVIRDGTANELLLDLLIGDDGASGRDVYLRKNGDNEYRSGDSLIKTYATSGVSSWYNLALFEKNRAGEVQRIEVGPVKGGENGDSRDYVLVRDNAGWKAERGGTGTPSTEAVDGYVRAIFDSRADDFLPRMDAAGLEFGAAKLRLELGDGSAIVVQAGEEVDGKRPVTVSGSQYNYLFSGAAVQRLFRLWSSLL